MDEFKNLAKIIKDNIILLLLLIYSISFSNYYIFYKSFDISIFSYVGLNDLIFFTMEYVFNIVLIVFVAELIIYIIFTFLWLHYEKFILVIRGKTILYLSSSKTNKKRLLSVFDKHFSDRLLSAKFLLIIFGIFALGYAPNKLIFIPAYFVYTIYLMEITSKEKMYRFSVPFASAIIVLALIFTTLFSSYSKRFEKEDYTISFNEDDERITTEKGISSLNYLGETSTNIFLYDIKKKRAKIYNKANITRLEIQNSGLVDYYIISIRDSYVVRYFTRMFNEEGNLNN